ncbi:MAG: hypothetical protein MUO52_09455, partial [Desulfobacterales bacterium]|nr:hypothetical protein [Desulfobacterales bacterium]
EVRRDFCKDVDTVIRLQIIKVPLQNIFFPALSGNQVFHTIVMGIGIEGFGSPSMGRLPRRATDRRNHR